jgi:uncharacterized protein (TIGR02246 family)
MQRTTTPTATGPRSVTVAPHVDDTSVSHDDDRLEIEALVAEVERGFNTNDPERSVRPFAANASAVGVTGQRVAGRDALLEAHRLGYAGPLRDQYAHYELGDVVFLRPEVAVAHKRAWATDAAGERLHVDHAMVALYVFVKEDGRWWVAARQNTLVPGAA